MNKEPLPPLTDEQTTQAEMNLLKARQVMRDFMTDATMAHNYHQNASWRVWGAIANNTLTNEPASTSTQVTFTARAIRNMVEMVVPNHAHGHAFRGEIAKGHAEVETKKAQMVRRLCDAGETLLADYPRNSPWHQNTLDFMRDHAAAGSRWLATAVATEKAARYTRTRKPVQQGQQSLI